jgi:hypothetical protein
MKYVIITQLKNQEERIKEWILYHHLQGFDTFIIFDDHSEDGTVNKINEVKEKYNINIIVKYTDKIGGSYDKSNCINSDSYRHDSSLGDRILRSYTFGNNIVKENNPEAICSFIDIDEFIVTSENKKVVEIFDDYFYEKDFAQLIMLSLDARHDYELKENFISNNETYIWDYDFAKNHPIFSTRGKSTIKSKYLTGNAVFVHCMLEPNHHPHEFNNKTIRPYYDEIRIIHYRIPNLTNSDEVPLILDNTVKTVLNTFNLNG